MDIVQIQAAFLTKGLLLLLLLLLLPMLFLVGVPPAQGGGEVGVVAQVAVLLPQVVLHGAGRDHTFQ